MAWLQASALGQAMRGHWVWTYGIVNLIHILGVSTFFGSVLILDLRLLGLRQRVPLASVSTLLVPISAAGFAVAACSGICLFATKATEYYGNPFLSIKFAAIGLGILNFIVLSCQPAWKGQKERDLTLSEQVKLKVAALVSLLSWLTTISAGRMIGYWQ